MLNLKGDRAVRFITLALIPVGIIAATATHFPVKAHHEGEYEEVDEKRKKSSGRNDFDVCLRELIEVDIEVREAADACARALEPRQLSRCVVKINDRTPVAAEDALKTCFQVRRPPDLATCVVDIHGVDMTVEEEVEIEPSSSYSTLTLDSCRRSLLPKRYSKCVLALSRNNTEILPTEAMEICISAEAYPDSLLPALIDR